MAYFQPPDDNSGSPLPPGWTINPESGQPVPPPGVFGSAEPWNVYLNGQTPAFTGAGGQPGTDLVTHYTPPPAPTPPPPNPGPSPGVGVGGGNPYSSSGFQFPQFNPPAWQGVTPFAAPEAPFSYKDFTAPTIEDARNEPGFAFALDEGQKALQNSAAHTGTLRSGGAEKGLSAWTNQFADQNYGNVFNRAAQVYGTNRGNAAENYLTNYNIAADTWAKNTGQQDLANQYNFNAAAAQFNPQFQASQLQFADLFNRSSLAQQGQISNNNLLGQLAGYGYQ